MLEFKFSPTPDSPKTILCLGAHSDDIEIGCGGAILRLLQEHPKTTVYWVVLSANEIRKGEAEKSAGIFLKDAAVMAGLVCIGENNLFVSPDYGPRIRLRSILLDAELQTTGAMKFDPCKGCDMPCRSVCPQAAFSKKIYRQAELGLDELPGRNGVYDRFLCNQQMESDILNSEKIEDKEQVDHGKVIKYCRKCEFACPVGR